MAALMPSRASEITSLTSRRPRRADHRLKIHSIIRSSASTARSSSDRCLGIFPNEDAITRPVGAPLLEQNDESAVQRGRFMSIETIAPLSDDPTSSCPLAA